VQIGKYMEDSGVKFRNGVVPSKLVKNSDGTIAVTFSDGNSENYDTVLVAIGRSADTSKLGLENVGVKFSDRNGKIPCVHEQTNTPNVYAIGDVMEVSRERSEPRALWQKSAKLFIKAIFEVLR